MRAVGMFVAAVSAIVCCQVASAYPPETTPPKILVGLQKHASQAGAKVSCHDAYGSIVCSFYVLDPKGVAVIAGKQADARGRVQLSRIGAPPSCTYRVVAQDVTPARVVTVNVCQASWVARVWP